MKVMVECKKCGVSFYKKESEIRKTGNNFCSRSCAAKYNNVKYPKKKKVLSYCIYCGNILSGSSMKFCNAFCQSTFRYEQYIFRWKKGLETGQHKSGKEISAHVRRYLRTKYGDSCCKCGWNLIHPVTRRIPLQIHHIDGDCLNTIEDNLELLCPNCHSLTINFGSLNPKGNGRRMKNLI